MDRNKRELVSAVAKTCAMLGVAVVSQAAFASEDGNGTGIDRVLQSAGFAQSVKGRPQAVPCISCVYQKDLICAKWQVPMTGQSGCDVGGFSGKRGLIERDLGFRRESAHTKPAVSCHTCVHMRDDKTCSQIKRAFVAYFDAPMAAKVSDQTVCASHFVRETDARKTFGAMHEYLPML